MATTSDFRNGLCLEKDGKLFQITEFQHVKPGKGPAFVRTKLRNLDNGRLIDHTWTAGVKINTVRIERRKYQYLYHDDMGYHIMNTETFDQVAVQKNLVDSPDFLKEGMEVEAMVKADDETFLGVELPAFIEAEITYTEPGIKGNTATNAMKAATIETGAQVKVPLFINIGDKIKVDTRSREYSERIKG
jgi:elongation factor P